MIMRNCDLGTRQRTTPRLDTHYRLTGYHGNVSAVRESGDSEQAGLALACGLNAPSSAWYTGIDRQPHFKSGPLSTTASCSLPSPTTT